jgi:NADPH:quinone reductase-like Zn-dependent oxidoreductase
MYSQIPSSLSFEEGATLPAAVATAAFGLYSARPTDNQRGGAALIPPWANGGRNKYAGEPILVIGGSSAVGQQGDHPVHATPICPCLTIVNDSAIQFAKLSGFSPIITTASLHNASFLESLGATHVIDRTAVLATAVKTITSQDIKIIYDAISEKDTQNAAYDILVPEGTLITVLWPAVEKDKLDSRKSVVVVYGMMHDPNQKEIATDLCKHLPSLIESGDIKVN